MLRCVTEFGMKRSFLDLDRYAAGFLALISIIYMHQKKRVLVELDQSLPPTLSNQTSEQEPRMSNIQSLEAIAKG